MTTTGNHRMALLSLLLFGMVATSAGCESKGPAQQAGESIDKGIQSAKDTVNPPSTGEKVGRSVDKALGK